MKAPSARPRGLTFLEVLLAVSMLGLLMVGASTLLFAMAQSYFSLESAPQYERHADGISGFLHSLATYNQDALDVPGPSFGWKPSPVSKKPVLSWNIDKDMPFFVSELQPLPPLTAYLEFDEENGQFWLVWHPDTQFTEGKPQLQYTLLSPWAADIEYGYFDPEQKQWEFELASAESREHGNQKPDRMRLIFERNGERLSRYLDLHTLNRHVLAY